jgi:hypothetical protein
LVLSHATPLGLGDRFAQVLHDAQLLFGHGVILTTAFRFASPPRSSAVGAGQIKRPTNRTGGGSAALRVAAPARRLFGEKIKE